MGTAVLSSKYIFLCCGEEWKSHKFEMTWGWVNDDRIKISGWTLLDYYLIFKLKAHLHIYKQNLLNLLSFLTHFVHWVLCQYTTCGVSVDGSLHWI